MKSYIVTYSWNRATENSLLLIKLLNQTQSFFIICHADSSLIPSIYSHDNNVFVLINLTVMPSNSESFNGTNSEIGSMVSQLDIP